MFEHILFSSSFHYLQAFLVFFHSLDMDSEDSDKIQVGENKFVSK